jgi:hypothetical protein
MSEFKYACPVCGQHMMCDSSQSGTIMECPTCFQKIVAPQAPTTNDPKFILTGTKYTEKKIADSLVRAAADSAIKQTNSKFVGAFLVAFLILIAGSFAFHKVLFKSSSGNNPPGTTAQANGDEPTPPPKPAKPEKPVVVAPPASDTNWTLTLDSAVIPDSPVAGRIHAHDFIAERATFQNGSLTLRSGTRGQTEFGVIISFGGAQPESLSGQTINISSNADKAARVTFRWKDDTGTVQKENHDDNYAMRLEFGPLANNRLPGKIYLCTTDPEKSYLLGTFSADARKPKPKAPKK